MMFISYFLLASKAIAKIALVGLCGYYFSSKGILNKSALRTISVLSVELFTPCLLYSKMIETLDKQMLMELWLTPIIYFLYGGLSFIWVYSTSKLFKINQEYQRLLMVAVFFSNTNSLPLSLIQTILISPGAIFLRKDPQDTSLMMTARGISYTLIFATLNNLLRWSLGVVLMGENKNKNSAITNKTIKSAFHSVVATPNPYKYSSMHENANFHVNVLNSASPAHDSNNEANLANQQMPDISLPRNPLDAEGDNGAISETFSAKYNGHITPKITVNDSNTSGISSELSGNTPSNHTLHNSPHHKISAPGSFQGKKHSSPNFNLSPANSESDRLLEQSDGSHDESDSGTSHIKGLKEGFLKMINVVQSYLTTPVYAIIFGIISVSIPAVKDTLLDPNATINFVYGAIDLCGEACVPLVILSLGGQLAQVPKAETPNDGSLNRDENVIKRTASKLKNALEAIFASKKDISSNKNSHLSLEATNHVDNIASSSHISIPRNELNHLHTSTCKHHLSGHTLTTGPNLDNGEDLERGLKETTYKPKSILHNSSLSFLTPFERNSLNLNNIQSSLHKKFSKSKSANTVPNNSNTDSQFSKQQKHVNYNCSEPYDLQANDSSRHQTLNPIPIRTTSDETSWSDSDCDVTSNYSYESKGSNSLEYVSPKDERSGIAVVLLGRFAFVPFSAIGILLTIKLLFPSFAKLLSEDPVFFFTLLVLSATPPAINLITLVQATGRYENQAAHILMWSYLVGIFVLSAEVGLFMWLTNWVFN